MKHRDSLELRLSNERIRLANATSEDEKILRAVWVGQLEDELRIEIKDYGNDEPELSDAELLRELMDE